MEERDATVATRTDGNRTVHRRTTPAPGLRLDFDLDLNLAPLKHATEKVKLEILLASFPVLTVGLAGLCATVSHRVNVSDV
jgi:hypothetical protein